MKVHHRFFKTKGKQLNPAWNAGGSFTRCRHSGFSMVELLVAISVIAVLAAVLIPVLSSVRQKSLSASCQSNLRQIGIGLTLYVVDHDGAFIQGAVYRPVNTGIYLHWYQQLEPYMGGSPDKPSDRPAWQLCPAKKIEPMSLEAVGYGWNHTYFGHAVGGINDDDTVNGANSRITEVENPADTIIIGDSKDATTNDLVYENRYLYSNKLHAERHSGGGNYLFVDGHVEWMTPAQLRERLPGVFRKQKGS